MGCDKFVERTIQPNARFNSRSPNGLRRGLGTVDIGSVTVSIHAAQMGCDQRQLVWFKPCMVSIHAAQMGCDLLGGWTKLVIPCFNSRSPNGLRLFVGVVNRKSYCVSIHAAQMGCDLIV